MSDNITVTAPAVSGSSGGELSLTHEGFPGPFPNFNTLLSIYGAKLQNGTVLSEMLGSVNKTLVDRRSDAATMEEVLRFMKTCVYTDNCVANNPGISHLDLTKAYYDTATRDNYQLSNAGNKLSTSPFSVVAALNNFLWGNGREMYIEIAEFGDRLNPKNMTGFAEKAAMFGAPGQHSFQMRFNYNTAQSNDLFGQPGLILGNVTLNTEGTFTRNASGSWEYTGVVRGFPDTYDFNKSTHRDSVAEGLTTVGRFLQESFNGTPYTININGELHVHFTGQ